MSKATAQLIETAGTLTGNLEEYSLGVLEGWVFDKDDPGKHLSVIAYDGNQRLAEAVADVFRLDLKNADIGQGDHAFRIDIGTCVLDGQAHSLSVVEAETGHILGTCEITEQVFANATVEQIEAGFLRGVVTLTAESEHTGFDLSVLIDGVPEAQGSCLRQPGEKNQYLFAVKLPDVIFDNSYHAFSVRLNGFSTRSSTLFDKLLSVQTPWNYLVSSAKHGTLSALSSIAAYRYSALQSNLDLLASNRIDSARMKNIKHAHDVVVEGHEGRTKFPALSLRPSERPKFSILIPVHNKFELTYHCLASIILNQGNTELEVIVIDDRSSDHTTEIESIIENVKVCRNEKNLGFLLSIEAGAASASGEYIVLLNNDTEVTPNWISKLEDVFEQFADVGAAGCKLIYPTGKLQEAGGIVWGSGKPWNVGNGRNAEHPSFNYTRQVDYLSGAALMLRTSVWTEIGGFSKEFAPAYYEDTDLAFKIRAAGYKTFYCPASVVIHFEGMSNGRELNAGIKRFQSINAPRFRAKWRRSYRLNGREGVNLNLEKDRNVDFRVLMIDYAFPKEDQDAGGYASIQEIKLLQELGCKVTFIPNNMAHMGKYTFNLQEMGVECIYAPFYTSPGDYLKEHGKDLDIVYITRYDIAECVLPSIREFSRAKVVFNNADLHFLRELRAALSARGDLEGPIRTRERELKVMREVDAVLSYNEVEHSVITSHNLVEDSIHKCPWVLTDKKSSVPFSKRSGIAFLGGFNHVPNREAVIYFVNTIVPLLRIADPDIVFDVYGSNVTPEIELLESDNVRIRGYVEDLADLFNSCRVFIAPLLSGAGIKGKVLESISFGVPCVLSPIAAESTGLVHDVNALVASTPEEWVTSITRLYGDEALWERLSQASNRLVHDLYSREKGLQQMSKMMQFLELEPAVNGGTYFRTEKSVT